MTRHSELRDDRTLAASHLAATKPAAAHSPPATRRTAHHPIPCRVRRSSLSWLDHPKSSKYGVRWSADKDSPSCELCEREWTVIRRRHHCRKCGRLVCDQCSPTKQPVSGSTNPKRTCIRCIEAKAAAQLLITGVAAARG